MAFWTGTTLPAIRNWVDSASKADGSLIVAIEYGTQRTATSIDGGTTWTEHATAMPSSSNWVAITHNGNVFCAVSITSGTIAATSTDGVTWTLRTLPATAQWTDVCTAGSATLVAIAGIGSSNQAAYSTNNGASWTSATLPSSHDWEAVAYNGTVVCAVASNTNVAATSADNGATWTGRTMAATKHWTYMAWDGTVFAAVTYDNAQVDTSPDGITWANHTIPYTGVGGITAAAGLLVVTNVTTPTTGSAYSTDHGVTWTTATLPASATWGALCVAGSNIITLSSDAANAAVHGVTATLQLTATIGMRQVLDVHAYTLLAAGIAFEDTDSGRLIQALVANLNLTGTPSPSLRTKVGASDEVSFGALLACVWHCLAAAGIDAVGTAAAQMTRVGVLIDALHSTGAATSRMNAKEGLIAALAINALMASGWKAESMDSVVFQDALAVSLHNVTQLLAGVSLAASNAPKMRLTAICADHFDVDATDAAKMHLFAQATDQVVLYATLSLGAEEYAGWVLNEGAPSEYTHYPFNGFCLFDDHYYGTAADGLYLLEGADDNGVPIQGSILTAMQDFGTGKRKMVPDVYIAFTGSNKMVLKVTTTDRVTGAQRTDIYTEMVPAAGDGTQNGRFKIGRGLDSVYWQFELQNVAGGALDIEHLQFRPLVLDKRY